MGGWPPGFGPELDRTSMADLAVLTLGPPDEAGRDALLDRVRAAAAMAPDRVAAIDRARRDVADVMLVRLNRAGQVVTWAGLPWSGASSLRAEDRVWLTRAAQDAAVADMLADRLAPDDRDQLRAGWDVVSSMPGLGHTGVPSIRGPIGRAATVAFGIAVLVTGATPFLLLLAAQGHRRTRDEGA